MPAEAAISPTEGLSKSLLEVSSGGAIKGSLTVPARKNLKMSKLFKILFLLLNFYPVIYVVT